MKGQGKSRGRAPGIVVIVNQNGIVYQAGLGPKTTAVGFHDRVQPGFRLENAVNGAGSPRSRHQPARPRFE